jgi:cation:H+ antiporter
MLADTALLVLGLLLLLGGGEALVRGATGLARRLGVSTLVIGLTVVAFGTSAPELAVNVIAALRGRGEISFGNIIGSNMANIGLIVGCTALIRPILIQRVVIYRELPMMLLGTAAAIVMACDRWLSSGPDVYDRADGVLLLMLFCVFLYYTVGDFVTQQANNHREGAAGVGREGISPEQLARLVALTLAGLAMLILGAHVSVNAAVDLARGLGVPEVIIGLTVLAVGTSLPELAASVVASLRGHVELAIGNVVGSNIFNLLLVAGVTASIRPIPVPPRGSADLWVMAILSVLLLTVSLTGSRRIVRTEAIGLLLIYLGYLTWRAGFSIHP